MEDSPVKISELIESLQKLTSVYGDLEVKLWPFRDQGSYRDCTVIVSGVDHKVLLIDEAESMDESETPEAKNHTPTLFQRR